MKQFAACRMWLVTNGFASPGRQWLPCLGVLAGIILTVCGFSGCGRREFRTDAQLVADANRDLKLGQFDLAIQTADAVSESSEHWGKAQLIAGEARMRSGDLQAALVCYLRIAEQVPDRTQAATATFAAGEIHREFGRLHDAQRLYRRVLAASPDFVAAHRRLAFVMTATGQQWQAMPHYDVLLHQRTIEPQELALLADLDRPVDRRDYLDDCATKAPKDPLVELGQITFLVQDREFAQARQRLEKLLQTAPELVSGQLLLGELLVDQADQQFRVWHKQLPRPARHLPETWFIRGLWARKQGELHLAARCFCECVRGIPTHRRALYQLGQVLAALRHPAAPRISRLSDLAMRMSRTIDDVLRTDFRDEVAVRETVYLLDKSGRDLEAVAWAQLADRMAPHGSWRGDIFQRLMRRSSNGLPARVRRDLHPASVVSLEPPDDFFIRLAQPEKATTEPGLLDDGGHIQFNLATALPKFLYHNGDDPSTAGLRVFETNGGGVAVLDFDHDGNPDLFLTQGGDWPGSLATPPDQMSVHDCLLRNVDSQHFTDVSRDSLPLEHGFGQGCTAGDFNNDGFGDLYVANAGPNQLLQNLGDGTFEDVTAEAELKLRDWTTSVLIADLNADGMPELFDVNYLSGEGVYQRICDGKSCSPGAFQGTADRLLVNCGSGTFELVPEFQNTDQAKGMGVVTLPGKDPRRPDLFIANDQVPNFLLRNQADDSALRIRLQEEAFTAGVAYNHAGLAMACMGIAASDANGDGLIDLFVTNFANESSTLYVQEIDGFFVDVTDRAGLSAGTFPLVGWGTQFLDADLDGRNDLVCVNGHVDDFRDEGGMFQMRPQFFWNRGSLHFEELFTDASDGYFAQKYLGRGLARVDWNRDRRMDFVVSNIGAAASLVTNSTQRHGHALNLRLHAVSTARDAIGTRATVETGDSKLIRYLLAGDGYQACNERVLQFGLGRDAAAVTVTVDWPSGITQLIREVPADCTLELVEGRTDGTLWSGVPPQPAVFRWDVEAAPEARAPDR